MRRLGGEAALASSLSPVEWNNLGLFWGAGRFSGWFGCGDVWLLGDGVALPFPLLERKAWGFSGGREGSRAGLAVGMYGCWG